MNILTQEPTTNQAILDITPLGEAIRTRIDFDAGWAKCARYLPLEACANEHQRRGWWACLDAEAGATYEVDAVQRGVLEEERYVPGAIELDSDDYLPF
jgi:hypothetical protein